MQFSKLSVIFKKPNALKFWYKPRTVIFSWHLLKANFSLVADNCWRKNGQFSGLLLFKFFYPSMSADFYFFPYHRDSSTTRRYLREPVLGGRFFFDPSAQTCWKIHEWRYLPKNWKFSGQETETQQSRLKPIQNNRDFFISCWKGFQWKEKQLL